MFPAGISVNTFGNILFVYSYKYAKSVDKDRFDWKNIKFQLQIINIGALWYTSDVT